MTTSCGTESKGSPTVKNKVRLQRRYQPRGIHDDLQVRTTLTGYRDHERRVQILQPQDDRRLQHREVLETSGRVRRRVQVFEREPEGGQRLDEIASGGQR